MNGEFLGLKETISQYWDWRSQTYTNGFNAFDADEKSVWKSELAPVLENNNGMRVLDVGTGHGFLALLLAEMGYQVTGVDLSSGMLEKAKKNAEMMGLDVSFHHADAENLPFDDESFDLIVSRHLLWTLPNPKNAVMEWIRVVKQNGSVLAIDGSWFDPSLNNRLRRGISKTITLIAKGKLPSFYSVFDQYYNPIRGELPLYRDISPSRICTLFEDVGLTDIAINYLNSVQRYHKVRAPLPYRIAHQHPTFLVKGNKTYCD